MTNVKRVLFIHIDFYGYNQRIVNKMRKLGYEVDCFSEDPTINTFEKLINKINPNYAISKSVNMQYELIRSIVRLNKKYDVIFVIKGARLESKFLDEIKKINPNAYFILYLWDDVARLSNFFRNREFYDKIFSFDKTDAEQYGLSFLPLFFCDEFRVRNLSKKDIDIFFSGWDHSNRREFIEKILSVLDDNNLKYHFHLYTGRWKVLKDKLKRLNFGKEPEYVKYNTLSLHQNAELTKRSKVIIDIQHSTQKGLTMRTIEALAAKAKLITTNDEVAKYDFYNTNNILIVDRENPIIDPEFLKTDYEDIPAEIIEQYSLQNWVSDIFEH